ncbi:SusD/RagB family nutrient-binding outer membrane lipoprotein [Flavihumibacter solisilvae]|uniref:SusD/RagB family nutrient-binding outer membrane lipoprotein n=1 Tax=Flavihumibacter solisilvae TaxID=1349421 RepID=A0A0C1LJV7_9BACT|nr:SusD/RagB family nutrient-binding outer membrane lipoprotein [Flavihumibacter solisilvae]KIC95653.1 hypothetical protein OI18_05240 [Flavihumibacter solisilvae]
MKSNLKIYCGLLLCVGLTQVSCKKESFVEANTSPNTLYSVNPEDQILKAAVNFENDFEYFYDVYRKLNYWLQYSTPSVGNGQNFTLPGSQFNYRYGTFYERMGPAVMDAIQTIEKMPAEQQASRVYQKAVAEIMMAYYAFYVSDINGSIPFTEAFQARYGGTLTPVYDKQETVFATVDQLTKDAVASLESTPSVEQAALGNNDPFYNGDYTKWIKAGNALRLKVALRLMKRDPNKLAAIANEVFADANQMSSIDDSWMLKAGPSYANSSGNWNPDAGFVAGRPVVEFMQENADPRLRIYYRPNKNGQYVGSFPSPDDAQKPANKPLYSVADTLSELQHRIFTPDMVYTAGETPTGSSFFPVVTYAEYCFIRADLAARNIAGSDAEQWYQKGVEASIQQYDKQAQLAKVPGYTPVTPAEITAYYAKPDVTFDPAKAQEQIAVQAYLDFYRNPMEAWAWWKRTGYPNTTSVLAWSELRSNGSLLQLPRRASLTPLPSTNANFSNQEQALQDMAADPDFGAGPGDPYGRVWWDKK